MRKRLTIGVAGVLMLGVGLRCGWAWKVISTQDVPLKEAVAIVEAWVKEHPKDADGYYVLGRVHAMGWAYGEKIPLVWFDRVQVKLPRFGDHYSIRMARDGENPSDNPFGIRLPDPKRAAAGPADYAELRASIEAYAKAVELDPSNALYEEGLAWMLQRKGEAGVAMAEEVTDLTAADRARFGDAIQKLASSEFAEREAGSRVLREAMPRSAGILKGVKTEDVEVVARMAAVFRDYWDLQALPHYRQAYALTVAADLKKEVTWGADTLISADAAESTLTILAGQPAAAKTGEVADLHAMREKLAEKRPNPVLIDF